MNTQSNADAPLEGMAGRPFRPHVDGEPAASADAASTPDAQHTVPLGDVNPTVPLTDLDANEAALADTAEARSAAVAQELDAIADGNDPAPSPFADVPPIESAQQAPAAEIAAAAQSYDAQAPASAAPAASASPYYATGQDAAPAANPGYPAAAPSPSYPAAPPAPEVPGYGTPAYAAPGYGAPQQLQPAPGGGYGGQLPPQQSSPFPAAPGTAAPARDDFGIWSLVCAGVGMFGSWLPIISWFSWLAPIAGVVLGIIGLQKMPKNNRALSLIGLIVNGALIAIGVLIIPLMLFFGFAMFGLTIPFWTMN